MWWTLVPFVLVAILVILVPGIIINLVAGLRPWQSVVLAPLVSTGVIATAAVLAQLAGLPYGPVIVAAWTAFITGAVFGIRRLLRRWDWTHAAPPDPLDPPLMLRSPRQWLTTPTGWLILAAVIAACWMTWDITAMIGDAQAFSQTYDNVFHLNAVRWVTENQSGSALDMRMRSGDNPSGFYPLAWHDLASLTLIILGSQDPVAGTTATIVSVVAVAWPLSCLWLVRSALKFTATSTLATGILVLSFSAFPYMVVGYGVLYPNLLGCCLLPALIGLAVRLFGLGVGCRPSVFATWVALLIGLAGVGLAHPNALVTFVSVVGVTLAWCFAAKSVVQFRRGEFERTGLSFRLGIAGGLTVIGLAAFLLIRPPLDAADWAPERSRTDAVGEALMLAPLDVSVLVGTMLLVLIGMYAAARTRRNLWAMALHGVVCVIWWFAATWEKGNIRWIVTGPWYADPPRLAALLPLSAILPAVIGVQALENRIRKQPLTAHLPLSLDRQSMKVTVGIVVAIIATTQIGPPKQLTIESVWESYAFEESTLVDEDEYKLIQRVPDWVAPGEAIAVNPYNGSSMVYALTGRPTTATHILYDPTRDQQLILDSLNEASYSPRVCRALGNLNVGWVLDFGQSDLINKFTTVVPDPGFVGLIRAPGFELVDSEGNARLFKITACD